MAGKIIQTKYETETDMEHHKYNGNDYTMI